MAEEDEIADQPIEDMEALRKELQGMKEELRKAKESSEGSLTLSLGQGWDKRLPDFFEHLAGLRNYKEGLVARKLHITRGRI